MHRRQKVVKIKTLVTFYTTGKAVEIEMYKVSPYTVQVTVVYRNFKKIWGFTSWDNLWSCLFLPQGSSMSFEHHAFNKISHPKGEWSNHLKLHFECKDVKVKWKDFREALLAIK